MKDYDEGKKYHTPKNEWIVIPDSHLAIVSKSIFDEVQEITANRRIKRKNMRRRDYLLHGKIICGCCGYALMYDNSCENKVYRCYHNHANPDADCYKMKVNAPELDEAVLIMIKKQAEVVLNNSNISNLINIGEHKKIYPEYESQIQEIKDQRKAYYEQYIKQSIDLKTFLEMKSQCTKKIDNLNNQLAAYKKMEDDKLASDKLQEIAERMLGESVTPCEAVEALVEKVYVFPDNRIEINWRIADFTALI